MRPLLLGAIVVAGCGGNSGYGIDGRPTADAPRTIDGGPVVDAYDITARPFGLYVPSGYVAGTPTPLVVLLHGYGASGAAQEGYFAIQPVAEAETFLYATPDGTVDTGSSRFWNATDACCDLYDSGIDDATYLRALIDDVAARYTVDPRRIYFVGHSNGGFMSHRMACDLSDRIAAIVSLAGMVWNDPLQCPTTAPVSVVQVHGTADAVVAYDGGTVFGQAMYPSAAATVATWRAKDGCTGVGPGMTIDLDAGIPGAETTVTAATGCPAGVGVELWSIAGGEHIPSLDPSWPTRVWAFFAAHPKP